MCRFANSVAVVTLLAGIAGPASAAIEWMATNGVLESARNVSVSGRSYDVSFSTGSCEDVYPGCSNASNLSFQTSQSANMATQALLAQVLVDGTPYGDFFDYRNKVRGCTVTESCGILTPFGLGTGEILEGRVMAPAAWASIPDNPEDTVARQVLPPGTAGMRPPPRSPLSPFLTWAVWRPVAGSLGLELSNGVLVGVRNLWVSGTLYDVAFEDGSCSELFGDCTQPGVFDFNSESDARAATRRLLDLVLQDGLPEGDFFDFRGKVRGCESIEVCWIVTPFAWGPDPDFDRINIISAEATPDASGVARDLVGPGGPGHTPLPDLDYSLIDSRTWARWTPVPEPGTLQMSGLALVMVAWIGKRRRLPKGTITVG